MLTRPDRFSAFGGNRKMYPPPPRQIGTSVAWASHGHDLLPGVACTHRRISPIAPRAASVCAAPCTAGEAASEGLDIPSLVPIPVTVLVFVHRGPHRGGAEIFFPAPAVPSVLFRFVSPSSCPLWLLRGGAIGLIWIVRRKTTEICVPAAHRLCHPRRWLRGVVPG